MKKNDWLLSRAALLAGGLALGAAGRAAATEPPAILEKAFKQALSAARQNPMAQPAKLYVLSAFYSGPAVDGAGAASAKMSIITFPSSATTYTKPQFVGEMPLVVRRLGLNVFAMAIDGKNPGAPLTASEPFEVWVDFEPATGSLKKDIALALKRLEASAAEKAKAAGFASVQYGLEDETRVLPFLYKGVTDVTRRWAGR